MKLKRAKTTKEPKKRLRKWTRKRTVVESSNPTICPIVLKMVYDSFGLLSRFSYNVTTFSYNVTISDLFVQARLSNVTYFDMSYYISIVSYFVQKGLFYSKTPFLLGMKWWDGKEIRLGKRLTRSR